MKAKAIRNKCQEARLPTTWSTPPIRLRNRDRIKHLLYLAVILTIQLATGLRHSDQENCPFI